MNILIGENIKKNRLGKGITQEMLADALGVTCAAVSKWERGETYPDITLLFPIAYYFGITLDELMGYDERKVEEDIGRLLGEIHDLYRRGDVAAADALLGKAYKEYPNDFRIMSAYIWSLGVSDAEPDLEVALEKKNELGEICEKLLAGCTDGATRLSAWKMKAILLHAEGRTEEALRIHEECCGNWYYASGQMSEQLFAKDTPEFLYFAKKNMYELASFAADKISKSIFFDASIEPEERIKKIEGCGEALVEAYRKTDCAVFAEMARSLFLRLWNDISHRGVGTEEDCGRAWKRFREMQKTVSDLSRTDEPLCDAIN